MDAASDLVLRFVANAAWQTAIIAGAALIFGKQIAPRMRVYVLAIAMALCVIAPLATPRQVVRGGGAIASVQMNVAGIVALSYLLGLAIAVARFGVTMLRARRIATGRAPVDGPITIGRRIYLPPRIARDPSLAAAALAHEEAHVAHNDYALHVALELLALPLWFHPLAHALRRAIAEAREMACDEEAAARCGARDYAGALVRIASLAVARNGLGMATTPIERRVLALVHRQQKRRTWTPIVPVLLLAIACTRYDAAPAIEHATLCGHWRLVHFTGTVTPRSYDAFTQTIEQGPARIAVRQHRVAGGRARDVAWTVITDGVARPVEGIPSSRGTAQWDGGVLSLAMQGPGEHRENVKASVRGGRLVCDGATDRGQYHAEFERVDP